MTTIYAIIQYIGVMTGPDPDYLNDYLVDMWHPVAVVAAFIGSML